MALGATRTGSSAAMRKVLLIICCALLTLGNCSGPLLSRLYFLHGGSRIWLSSWLETGGWPVLLLPLAANYVLRLNRASKALSGSANVKFFAAMNPTLLFASAGIGVLTGLVDYLYAYGLSRLPVSTSALVLATHLAFTGGFAYLLVRQRFTPYSINAMVLLTIGAVILGLHASKDNSGDESQREYYMGFFTTLAAGALYGFVIPAVELTYKKANQVISFSLVMETQLVVSFFATGFCTVGMLINNDFKAIPREARLYGLGETRYYMVLIGAAVAWQVYFVGLVGVIFCASSLFSAIVVASLLPVTGTLAVIVYKEKFTAEKGISLALSLWGFTSYFYGEFKRGKKRDQSLQTGLSQTPEV